MRHIQWGGLKEITFSAGRGQEQNLKYPNRTYTLKTYQIYDDPLLYPTFQTDILILKF